MSTLRNNHVAETDQQKGSLGDRVRSLRLQNRQNPTAGGQKNSLPWLLCTMLAISTLAFGFQAFQNQPKGSDTTEPSASTDSPANDVQTPQQPTSQQATSGNVALEAKGYIIARRKVQVSPRVSGIVENLYIEEGMKVNEGEILAQLEVVDYESDYLQAEYNLEAAKQRWLEMQNFRPEEIAQAKADVAEAKAQHEQKRLDLLRTERLLGTGAQNQREYELAKSEEEALARRIRRLQAGLGMMLAGPRKEKALAAKADMQKAEAELVKARWRLESCTVLAPISGTILVKNSEEGNLVNPAGLQGSFNLCEMADLSDLEVELKIQERDIAQIKVGQECIIMPEAFVRDKTFRDSHPQGYHGKVSRLMPVADRAQGAVPVRVKIDIPNEEAGIYLKPDMSARVTFKKVEK